MTTKHKRGAMGKKRPAHPGLELDAHGEPIPMEKRLPEDRAKAHRAAKKKRSAKKRSPK